MKYVVILLVCALVGLVWKFGPLFRHYEAE